MTVTYFAPWEEEKNSGVQCPWGVSCFFFGGHLPQTSGFRSAKQILVVSFATQARAFILSDRNIFYTPGGGEQRQGLMPLGLFLLFLYDTTCQDFLLVVCFLSVTNCHQKMKKLASARTQLWNVVYEADGKKSKHERGRHVFLSFLKVRRVN